MKITGEDGIIRTAMLNPQQDKTMVETSDAFSKVMSTSYNINIGRYDVAISTGPSSASKKMEANKTLMTIVNAAPEIMKVAGDLVVGSMDMAGADVLAKRLKALLPPGTTEEQTGQMLMLQQATEENTQLKQEIADMEKIIMAEREKSQAKLIDTRLQAQADLQQSKLESQADLFKQKMDDSNALQLAHIKAQIELETNTQDNIVKVIVSKIAAKSKIDVETIKSFNSASKEPTHESRMAGYMDVMGNLTGGGEEPMEEFTQPQPPPLPPVETPREPMNLHVNVNMPPTGGRKSFVITRPDGSQSSVQSIEDEIS